MSEKTQISRATGVMGGATLISRISGLVRDIVVGRLFGAGFATDAFFMAFTIPNLLRRFFAEGSLTAAFVPVFSEVHHRRRKEEAQQVARACWTLLIAVMLVVTAAGILLSPWIVQAIGYGFSDVPGKLALTDLLNRLMFPYIFFVSLLALITGILNVHGHFFLPSFSTVVLNLTMIGCALWLRPFFPQPIMALAGGVLVGGFLQLLLQVPVLRRYGISLAPLWQPRHPAVVRIARLMLPGLAGVAIYQINVVVTRLLASFLAGGSVSYLYYGQRLFEFPQGVFVVSLAQAVLPSMSRQAALGDDQGLRDSLQFAFKLIALVTIPAFLGLLLCAVPVYSLFFYGGEFSFTDVQQTAYALMAFAPGLFFLGLSRVMVPTFYALKDTRTPVIISFWTLLVNAGCGAALMQGLDHVGLALALTLSSLFNCIALSWALHRKLGRLGLQALTGFILRIIGPTALMGGVVYGILQLGPWSLEGHDFEKALVLSGAVLGGALIYAAGCWLLRVSEIREAAALVRKKITRRS